MKAARNLMLLLLAVSTIGLMFWFKKKHDNIKVEFVEAGKDVPFAVSMVPIGQLPETFEVATTLDIADKKWSVVDAIPKHRIDFEKSGKLRVVLSAIQMMNPQDILFSLPTLNDSMCALQEAASLDRMLVIHEDDWRQIEFVSDKLLPQVENEIQSIRTVYETKREGVGFTGVHIRKLIEAPIGDQVVPLSALTNSLGVVKEFKGFGISGSTAVAKRGFAFETASGRQFYGVSNEHGNVVSLCVVRSDGLADECADLMDRFQLIGVDWCKCEVFRSHGGR